MMAWAALILLFLSACATNSGVVEIGPNSYLIQREAGSRFNGAGSMKTDSIKEAKTFCISHGKVLKVTATQDTSTGSFPQSEVQFTCLNEGDSSFSGPLVPTLPQQPK